MAYETRYGVFMDHVIDDLEFYTLPRLISFSFQKGHEYWFGERKGDIPVFKSMIDPQQREVDIRLLFADLYGPPCPTDHMLIANCGHMFCVKTTHLTQLGVGNVKR